MDTNYNDMCAVYTKKNRYKNNDLGLNQQMWLRTLHAAEYILANLF